ncbi:16247_t:CDS:2 [Cetraspora pellucida]|uniref:16247_t:CDS:1 n=1 Tax=Cetraspora pellucida TaxID=1433469 RepID=A0A9N9H128_9GLOM|nr:16247_t:CDS:2 [Cetraspora pellucida]
MTRAEIYPNFGKTHLNFWDFIHSVLESLCPKALAMFEKGQGNDLFRYKRSAISYHRLFNRRSNHRFTLIILLIGAVILIIIIKPQSYSDPRALPELSGSLDSDFSTTDLSQLAWKINLNKKINSRTSFYKHEHFTKDALKRNNLIPVTAIVLGWKRTESLKVVVNYISKYPYIKEILIWNNNNGTKLNVEDFKLDNMNVVLNVFNSDENLHDLSKYITCSMAEYDYCYFQDDDWLNLYMDSTYTNFLRNPSLIHSNTMPLIHLEHRRWMFSNADKNLHTGFTWLGCGSFIPRAKVQKFMSQLGYISLPKDHLKVADMYFSLWSNQYPYQLSNPLTPLDQDHGWSSGIDHWSVVYNSDMFERVEETPYYHDRYVRAPCINDKCLFITNIDPFPHPSSVHYANNITNVHEQEAKFNALDFPSNEFWEKHSYHNAVDLDLTTCWNSFKIPKKGDYFGLQFVEPKSYNKVTIVSSKDISNFDASFTVEISSDGYNWKICEKLESSYEAQDYDSIDNIVAMDLDSADIPKSNIITMDFKCFEEENKNNPVSFIKFQATRDFIEPFEICSFILDGLSI